MHGLLPTKMEPSTKQISQSCYTREDQKLPTQKKKFLALRTNKTELIKFLLKDWSTNNRHLNTLRSKTIYFSCGDQGFKIDVHRDLIRKTNVTELSSNQEVADTKMLLAVKIAEEIGCTQAMIFTVDSDVGILACYIASLVNIQIIVQIGTGRNKRLLDISGNTLDVELIQAMPSLHAIFGCDSVSAVHGMGSCGCLLLKTTKNTFNCTGTQKKPISTDYDTSYSARKTSLNHISFLLPKMSSTNM